VGSSLGRVKPKRTGVGNIPNNYNSIRLGKKLNQIVVREFKQIENQYLKGSELTSTY
jgi:hypothetical protein